MSEEAKPITEVPAGKMRVWDPEQKKEILVTAPAGRDRITLTIRLHDAAERKDAKLSASWAVIDVDRGDLAMPAADFLAKYIAPHLSKLAQLKLT